MAFLTIAIPTYNRNEMVLELVRNLLAQISGECKILIFDNGSPVALKATLEAGIKDLTEQPVRIVRLEANVGQGVLRCMELCDTPWMWLLTDKAVPRPNAIRMILDTIRAHDDCILINFTPKLRGSSNAVERFRSVETLGQCELIENVIHYGAIIDYMANVYHVPSYRESLGVASLHMGSGAPQFAAVLHAVGETGKCFLSADVPMERPRTPPGLAWSSLKFLGSYMTPLSLVDSEKGRSLLAKRILEFLPSRKYFIALLVQMAISDRQKARYHYRIYKQLMRANDSRATTRLYLLAGDFMMLAPKASVGFLEMIAQRVFHRSLREAT